MKQKWFIESADLTGSVEAENAEAAFLLLLESENPESLARLYRASPKGFAADKKGQPVYWCSTEAALQRARLMD